MKAHGRNERERVLWMSLFTPGLEGRRGLPYVLVGDPGTVKTSIIKQLAREAGLAFEAVIGSLRMPTDFLGIPIPTSLTLDATNAHLSQNGDSSMTVTENAPAGFAIRAVTAQRAVVFFDEFSTSPPAVQAAMLRVLFEGVVGELQLPPGVRMLCAMNEVEDAAGGWDISPAMANRLGWIDWAPPTVDEFTEYLIGSKGRGSQAMPIQAIDAKAEEAGVDAMWGAAWAKAVGEVAGFLRVRGDGMLHAKPKAGTPQANRAWRSARTWDLATHALAGSYVYDLTEAERNIAVSAYISSPPYVEFTAWRRSLDLPDPEAVLDGVCRFKPTTRIDITAAVVTGCVALIAASRQSDKAKTRAVNMWRLLKSVAVDTPDLVVPAAQVLCRQGLVHDIPEAFDVLQIVEPMFSIGGIKV